MEDYSLGGEKATEPDNSVPKEILVSLTPLSEAQLMNLRHHLDMVLKIEISQLNLTEELGLQYRQGKTLLDSLQGSSTPANQKAQVFNSLQTNLDKIIKHRTNVFSQERLKRYEAALLKVLEMKGNEKEQELFLELYGEFLRDRGQ